MDRPSPHPTARRTSTSSVNPAVDDPPHAYNGDVGPVSIAVFRHSYTVSY